jgi:hypothetical protein
MARIVRESTKATDNGRIRTHLLPEFGDRQIRDTTPVAVRTWVARLAQRRAPKAVRHCHGLLPTMLSDTITEGLLFTNPCRGTRMPPVGASIAKFLSPAEIVALVETTPVYYRPLITSALHAIGWSVLVGLCRVSYRPGTTPAALELGGDGLPRVPVVGLGKRGVPLGGAVVDAGCVRPIARCSADCI